MKFEKLGTNYAKFTFKVTPGEFAHALDHAFEEVKGDVEIKGFRKGTVPRNIYESKFGIESLYEKALNHVIYHLYPKVFEEKSVIIVGEPKIDLDVKTVSHEKDFEIKLIFPIKPEVKLGEYTGLEVKKRDLSVEVGEIDEEIDRLLSRDVVLEPKEGELQAGDVSVIDFEGFLNDVPFEGGKGENYELKIGSNQFIPGFEYQLIGMKKGEERTITVTFPEDYHSEELKGKETVFKVKLHEIKVEVKPELTDEFVVSLNKEGVSTVEELKESIKKEIKSKKELEEKDRIIGEAVKYAVSNAEVDIPIELINQEVENTKKQIESQAKQYGIEYEMYIQFSGMTVEAFEANLNSQAQNKVLTSLVIEAIAEKEDFPVSDEEIEAKYQEIATHYGIDVKEVKAQLTKEIITNEVRFSKAVDFLEASVKEVKF
ncbi:MAG: trigger factor [Acholeplasmataceae bacterium]|jgi:trigger factor|nr:trigger factor [Acholeplasmataceae bacterium]